MLVGELLRAKRKQMEAEFAGTPGADYYKADVPFTCDTCLDNERCDCAFDAYNTGGDCLAAK